MISSHLSETTSIIAKPPPSSTCRPCEYSNFRKLIFVSGIVLISAATFIGMISLVFDVAETTMSIENLQAANADTASDAITRNYTLLNQGGVEYQGNDILYWHGPFSGCAAQCDATANCMAYVLHKDVGANCWLKSGTQNPTINNNRDTYAVSTQVPPLGISHSYTLKDNGGTEYIGNDLLYWQGPFSSCATVCDITPQCVAYSLHKDNGENCWIKSLLQTKSLNSKRDTYVRAETGATTAPSRDYYLVNGGGVDYQGRNITYWIGPFTLCKKKCDQTMGCIAYTLDKPKGANCYLKSALENPKLDQPRDTYVLSGSTPPFRRT